MNNKTTILKLVQFTSLTTFLIIMHQLNMHKYANSTSSSAEGQYYIFAILLVVIWFFWYRGIFTDNYLLD